MSITIVAALDTPVVMTVMDWYGRRDWVSYVVYPPRKPNLQVVVDNSKESKEH